MQGSTEIFEIADSSKRGIIREKVREEAPGGVSKVRALLSDMQRKHLEIFERSESTRLEAERVRAEARRIAAETDEIVMRGGRGLRGDEEAIRCAVLRQERELAAAKAATVAGAFMLSEQRMQVSDVCRP